MVNGAMAILRQQGTWFANLPQSLDRCHLDGFIHVMTIELERLFVYAELHFIWKRRFV
jgi:hypothetical protein